jgi:uncharacterized protein (TIGR02588 family)
MKKPRKNLLEWFVFAVSACIVAAVAGYLTVSALRGEKSSPDLHVAAAAPERTHSGHRVAVSVRNTGETTAEQVRIEAVLMRADEVVERAELDIAFVPRLSEREGWVTFHNDPACCRIVTRAMSYEVP